MHAHSRDTEFISTLPSMGSILGSIFVPNCNVIHLLLFRLVIYEVR